MVIETDPIIEDQTDNSFGQFRRSIVSSVTSARFTRVAIRPRGRKCLTGGSCLSYAFINGNYPATNSYNRFIRVGHPICDTCSKFVEALFKNDSFEESCSMIVIAHKRSITSRNKFNLAYVDLRILC